MSSPLDTAYNRLDEVHRAWHSAFDGYHQIEDFRAGINTAIQALRNLTLTLQKQKENLPDFDSWYTEWQIKMKNNPILKEFHEARNIIVHQEDLILNSIATARTKGWLDFEKISFSFDPTNDSYSIAKGFYDNYAKHLPVQKETKKRLVFEFERKWVYDKLPEYELLEAITQAYNFFQDMLKDANEKFLIPEKEKIDGLSFCSNEFNDDNRLKCMIITSQERCLSFNFEDGKILGGIQTQRIDRDENLIKKVKERYGDEWKSSDTLSLLEDLFTDEYPFNQMKLFTQVAIGNLKKDKHLVPMSAIFTKKENPPVITSFVFANQEQKILAIDNIANAVIKNNAKHILLLIEAWVYKRDKENVAVPSYYDTKNAKDVFQIYCLSTKDIKIITIPLVKNILGGITFSAPQIQNYSIDDNSHNAFIVIPIIKALKQVAKGLD